MAGFVEKLRLKEMAEEDIYFAERDLELIEALHRKKLGNHVQCSSDKGGDQAKAYEKEFRRLTEKHRKKPRRLLKAYRKLVQEIKAKCHLG